MKKVMKHKGRVPGLGQPDIDWTGAGQIWTEQKLHRLNWTGTVHTWSGPKQNCRWTACRILTGPQSTFYRPAEQSCIDTIFRRLSAFIAEAFTLGAFNALRGRNYFAQVCRGFKCLKF